MADYASSLPVRTESAGDLIVKVCDATVESQQLAVGADGSLNITDNGGSLTVDATNLDIRDLAFATDKVDVSGSTISMTATDLDIRDLVFATDKVDVSGSSVTVSATNLDIRDLAFATDKVDVSGSSVTVSATNLDVRDLSHSQDSVKIGDGTDFLEVNSDGSINVRITDATPGTAVNDFNTVASVAAAGSSTHTYTSTGNFNLSQVSATGSGKLKIEIKVNGVTKFVLFNSTAFPNFDLELNQPALATTGQTVTVIRTNLENQPQDVYSTITGFLA